MKGKKGSAYRLLMFAMAEAAIPNPYSIFVWLISLKIKLIAHPMAMKRNLFSFKKLFFLLIFSPLLFSCNRLERIPYSPQQTPDDFLKEQPYTKLSVAGKTFILIQPTSTVFVYGLGLFTALIGFHFLRKRKNQKSGLWWGIALIFWGLGALLAGTSYQAFGFEIKCAGKEFCSWTSWWEVFYLVFTAASVDAMMMAQSYSSAGGKLSKALRVYAVVKCILFTGLIFTGAFVPVQFLVSFELLIIASLPAMIIFMVINAAHYRKHKDVLNLRLFLAWIILGLVIALYFGYFMSGIEKQLYQSGTWFTANDVLHLGLVAWMIYLRFAVAGKMQDLPAEA